jgi:hypothetical protein
MKENEARLLLGVKSTNPKDFQGFKKVPFHLIPFTAMAVEAMQFLDGGCKYGRENYREEGVRASIYFDAAIRHLLDWWHGEDRTLDSLLRHLGGVRASTGILIDASVNGKLIDDRAYYNGYATLIAELNKEVPRIAAMHKDKNPKHYSKLYMKDQKQERKNGLSKVRRKK